ncbi:unnamed protein product [Caenorhabditis brenneri]
MAGYPLGVLNYTGINEYYMVVLVLGACEYVLISVLAVFENRFDIICDFSWKRHWSKLRKGWLTLPCLTDEIRVVPVFILTEDYTYHIYALGSQLFTGVLESWVFIYCTILYIIRLLKSKRMSSTTIRLQIIFLTALSFQLAVVTAFMVAPLTYSLYSIMFDYYNQRFQNITIALETMHGLVSTFTMIFIHHPYRMALFEMLQERVRKMLETRNREQRIASSLTTRI